MIGDDFIFIDDINGLKFRNDGRVETAGTLSFKKMIPCFRINCNPIAFGRTAVNNKNPVFLFMA